MIEITDKNFEEQVIQSKIPVLVDLWAPWCGPCKMLGPILASVQDELESKIKIVKLNIDENPITPSNFGIKSIPTLYIFHNAKVVASKIGVMQKQQMLDWILDNI